MEFACDVCNSYFKNLLSIINAAIPLKAKELIKALAVTSLHFHLALLEVYAHSSQIVTT